MAKTVQVGWGDFFNPDTANPTAKLRGSLLSIGKVATVTGALTALVSFVAPLDVVSGYQALESASSGVSGSVPTLVSLASAGLSPVPGGVSPNGWDLLVNKVLWVVDYLMDGVIIFAGVAWMFGNRTKAIEILIGSGIGYIIVRHHDDIKNFFALL